MVKLSVKKKAMKALVFNGLHDILYETYDDPVMGTPNTKDG